jgi:hypothetical protein
VTLQKNTIEGKRRAAADLRDREALAAEGVLVEVKDAHVRIFDGPSSVCVPLSLARKLGFVLWGVANEHKVEEHKV